MPSLRDWLLDVLDRGVSAQIAPPELSRADEPSALAVLRPAYDRHALDVAGPTIPFDSGAALGSAFVLARACWQIVAGVEGKVKPLDVGAEASSPSAHLSSDLTLRFLPAVYRRAVLRSATEGLAESLEALLRRWPLSGVLADLDGRPSGSLEFGGHPGLQMLYAERLVATGRPGWVPESGPAREWAEYIYRERGKPLPVPPPREETGV